MTTIMKLEENWKEFKEQINNWYQLLMVRFNLKEVVNEEDHIKTMLERLETKKTLEKHQHKTNMKFLKVI